MKYPTPLLRRLALASLAGAGFFLTGVYFYICRKDQSLFFLSLVLSAASAMNNISLFRIMKQGSYRTLEGTCTDNRPALFCRGSYLTITSLEAREHRLLVSGSCPACAGQSYRFYFKSETPVPPGTPQFLIKAMSVGNFLGMERIRQ